MRYYFTCVSVFLLFSQSLLIAQQKGESKYRGNEIVWEGINALYNEEHTRSVQILSKAREDFPEHPVVHFVWAVSDWLRSQAYEGAEASYVILENDLDEISKVYENLVKKYPEDPNYKLYLASTFGMKARVSLGKKEWLGVLYDGFKGYRGVLTVHRDYPDLKDAYLPMGVLNFYVGNSFAIVKFFAGLLGMDADRDIGISQIKEAAVHGEYSWVEAYGILAWIYLWMTREFESVLPITDSLRTIYPNSVYFQYLYTESLILTGRTKEAEKNLELVYFLAESRPPASRKGWIPTLKYQSAYLKLLDGDFKTALVLVTKSIEEFNTELDTPLGFGYLLRGKINDLLGNREEAVSDYRSALKLNNYTWAMDEAKIYVKKPYQGTDD